MWYTASQMQPNNASPIWPVVGHEWAIALLAHAVATDQVRHAYLLTGPAQIGKTTLARVFAQAINCSASVERRPCGSCPSCQRIARDTHPDVRLIEPQGKDGQLLLIGQVRSLIHEAVLSPVAGRRKIFILCEMDRANAEAMNALLKTLEEPPPSVMLLLTSSHAERLLPTIISRCQVLPLRPVKILKVKEMLHSRGAEPERAALLARLSGGRPGWAITALADAAAWQDRQERLNDMVRLLGEGRVERFTHAERMAAHAEEAPETLILWASWWRDLLLLQQGCPQAIVNTDRRESLEHQATSLTLEQTRDSLTALASARQYLEQNVNARLVLETLLLHLPRVLDGIKES